MQRTSRRWYKWGITLALALVLLSCDDDDLDLLTGTWTGPLQDSLAGRGTLQLNLSHVNTQLTGTWQSAFPDAQHNKSGTLSGTANDRLSGNPRDVLITMVWSPAQAGTCTFTVEAMRDNNDDDHFTGTYTSMNCAQPESGTLDVNRQ
jgi:hypothetical protein